MLALLPLLVSLVPEVAKLIAGDRAGTVAAQVVEVARTVVGTDDPATAAAVLSDPGKLADLRIRLAEIAAQREAAATQARLEEMKAAVADTANARAQTVALAAAHSPIAWGAPIVSLVVTIGFFGSFAVLATRNFAPDPGAAAMLNIMVGALGAAFAGIVQFWTGSSAGSARKTDIIAQQAMQPQQLQAPPIATTGDVTVNNPSPSPPGTTADDLNAQQLGRPRFRVQAASSAPADAETWTPRRSPSP